MQICRRKSVEGNKIANSSKEIDALGGLSLESAKVEKFGVVVFV
jgi:hypothetical protein